MMRSLTIICFFSTVSIFCAAAEGDARFQTILDRYRTILLSEAIPPADVLLDQIEKLSSDGQWPDIDYQDKNKSGWMPLEHLRRITPMARAYVSPEHALHRNPELLAAIHRAIDHWLDKRYRNPNWWYNEIGVPRDMRDIVVLLDNDLQGERRQGAIEVVAQHDLKGTAANLMWSAELSLHHACLTGNEAQLSEAARRLWKEIKDNAKEGIKPDGSFMQHQARLHTFSYGLSYLEIVARLSWQLRDTPWSMPPEKRAIVDRFVLDGMQWMCRGTTTVPSTIDRAVTRKDRLKWADVRPLLRLWRDVSPERSSEIDTFFARQEGKGEALVGHRHFPYADFTVHHRPAGSIFLKTISTRTLPTESIIGENLKGVPFLHSGDHYVVQDGDELEGLQAVLKWENLPGITIANPKSRQERTGFVGGVSNGSSGLTAMDYVRAVDKKREFAVRKLWAFHGDTMICLLGGWKLPKGAKETELPAVTSLEQCRLRGAVEVGEVGNVRSLPEGETHLKNARWILHNKVGYVPIGDAKLSAHVGLASGSWASINHRYDREPEKVFAPVMRLLMQHDPAPTVQGYAIVLDADRDKLTTLMKKPSWTVLRNDRDCQSIVWNDGTTMAAFYGAGPADVGRASIIGSLTADQPCLAMWTDRDLWICDPTQAGTTVTITHNHKMLQIELSAHGLSRHASFDEFKD